jgi:hypothetical protein
LITISEVSNEAGFASLKPAWDALHKKFPDENPFLSFDWIFNYWKNLGQGELFIFTARENEDILCIAPLRLTRRLYMGLPLKEASFISTAHTHTDKTHFLNRLLGIENRLGWSDQADFLFNPENLEGLRQMIRHLKGVQHWDVLDLRELSPDSPTLHILEEEFQQTPCRFEKIESVLTKNVLLPDGFENFQKNLKRKTKRNIHQSTNRLNKLGNVVARHYQEPEEIDRIFPRLVEMEQKGKKGNLKTGSLIKEENRRFHQEFFRNWSSKKQVHLFTLERENNILTYLLVFKGKKIFYLHSTSVDPEFAQYSPGFKIMIEALKTLGHQGFTKFNLGRADGPVIRALSNDRQPRVWVKIFKKNFPALSLWFFEFEVRPKLKFLLSSILCLLKNLKQHN